MENQSKKILLLSDDPADVSFLSEIAVTQQADLEMVANASALCSKIAEFRADQSLAAIFVDVSAPVQLRKFEHELQSKMGTALATELATMIHFISGEALALNREILQSPYFAFYTERKTHDFARAAKWYQQSFYRAAEYAAKQPFAFDQGNRAQFFDQLKKQLLSKGASAEWILKFRAEVDELLEISFPARFECSFSFGEKVLRVALQSTSKLLSDQFRAEKFLHFGVSAIFSPHCVVLFIPIFEEVAEAVNAFKFYKVEA